MIATHALDTLDQGDRVIIEGDAGRVWLAKIYGIYQLNSKTAWCVMLQFEPNAILPTREELYSYGDQQDVDNELYGSCKYGPFAIIHMPSEIRLYLATAVRSTISTNIADHTISETLAEQFTERMCGNNLPLISNWVDSKRLSVWCKYPRYTLRIWHMSEERFVQ